LKNPAVNIKKGGTKMVQVGTIKLTVMPEAFFEKNTFEKCLWLWQIFFLWLCKLYKKWEHTTINLENPDADEDEYELDLKKLTFAARISHVELCIKIHVANSLMGTFYSVELPMVALKYYAAHILLDTHFKDTAGLQPTWIADDKMNNYIHSKAIVHFTSVKGRWYDVLQLLSFVVNFPLWCIRPNTWWGKQVIPFIGIGKEQQVCSTGIADILRAAYSASPIQYIHGYNQFFAEYETAMIAPCMFVISDKFDANDAISKFYN
jgi:hypothetical protein